MGRADCLLHMAWVPVRHLYRARIVPVLLSFVLLLVLLYRRIPQTVVGFDHTLVDIGVVLRAGISAWGLLVGLQHRCSLSIWPFGSSLLVVVDVIVSCSLLAAEEMRVSVLHVY